MTHNILSNAQFYSVFSDTTGAQVSTDAQATVVLDSAGYDSLCLSAKFYANANSTGGDSKLYMMHASSSESTSMVSCTGANDFVQSTAAVNGKLLVLDIFRPSKRYVSAYLTKDGANAAGVDITAILYNAGREPTSQSTGSAGVLASAVTVSPTT